MSTPLSDLPLLSRRIIEAQAIYQLHRVLVESYGEEAALAAVSRASQDAAHAAGRAFAAEAPDGPSLAHFSGMVERWRAGGALDIADVRLSDDELSFSVTRCGYLEAYRKLGLPDSLSQALSCCRDPALGAGYSPRLRLERFGLISEGCPACRFVFSWSEEEKKP